MTWKNVWGVFGENIVNLCKSIPQNIITIPLINQIMKSGTSIGANYMEANGASSKRDFRNKIYISRKECQETKHFLRMIAAAVPKKKEDIRKLWKECHQLTCIFQKITSSCS